jgi:hypothetical protein
MYCHSEALKLLEQNDDLMRLLEVALIYRPVGPSRGPTLERSSPIEFIPLKVTPILCIYNKTYEAP